MGNIKVKEINIERGNPTVLEAMQRLVNELSTAKLKAYKAVVVVHGYGSTGQGGAIKAAIKEKLGESSLRGIVRAWTAGEEWYARRKEFIDICNQLRDFDRYIDGNKGISVVLLK